MSVPENRAKRGGNPPEAYRFKKGQSGNPGGRPKRRIITDEYEKVGDQPCPEKIRVRLNDQVGEVVLKKGATWAQALSVRQFLEAIVKGQTISAREIREAIEGKAKIRMELSGVDGGPVETVYSELTDEQLEERRRKMMAVIKTPAIEATIEESEDKK